MVMFFFISCSSRMALRRFFMPRTRHVVKQFSGERKAQKANMPTTSQKRSMMIDVNIHFAHVFPDVIDQKTRPVPGKHHLSSKRYTARTSTVSFDKHCASLTESCQVCYRQFQHAACIKRTQRTSTTITREGKYREREREDRQTDRQRNRERERRADSKQRGSPTIIGEENLLVRFSMANMCPVIINIKFQDHHGTSAANICCQHLLPTSATVSASSCSPKMLGWFSGSHLPSVGSSSSSNRRTPVP